jgi:serine/threonine-protein kinase HipA
MTRLAFALYGKRAGILEREGGTLTLTYDSDYLDDPTATPLSLSLPLSGRTHGNRPVESYLRGLLPDNAMVRRRWAHNFGLKDRDTFGLIAAIGRDCAGGAIFVTESKLDEALGEIGSTEPLSEKQIGEHLRILKTDDAAWHQRDGEHWSLAGGQSKFALIKTARGWGLPAGSIPSTHIVKPGIANQTAQAMTEHVTMRALALMGEDVAQSEYREFDGEPAIVITRFDRLKSDTGRIVRLHSEDLAQAFGIDPSKKYEADGGPGAVRIAALLCSTSNDDSCERFVRALIANYLLAAPDAHSKNYSLLLAQREVRLAPLYDVATGLLAIDAATGELRYRRAAMAIGGQSRLGEIKRSHFERFADNIGFPVERILSIVNDMASRLPDALSDAIRELPPNAAGRELLAEQLAIKARIYLEHARIQGRDLS